MAILSRRSFLASVSALSTGCAGSRSTVDLPTPSVPTRPPALEQRWRYSKVDMVSGVLIDTETTRVSSVGQTVELEVQSEKQKRSADRSWGAQWLQQSNDNDTRSEALSGEVQKPWGMVLVDPHWSELQVYKDPIPLWPTMLRPGWSIRLSTTYKTSSDRAPLRWELTMAAHRWETITVPAGQFQALRYTNLINFQSTDFTRVDSQRRETIWFAPEIGRWVARESSGIYYHDDSVDDRQLRGNSFRWHLLEWS